MWFSVVKRFLKINAYVLFTLFFAYFALDLLTIPIAPYSTLSLSPTLPDILPPSVSQKAGQSRNLIEPTVSCTT